MCKEKYMSKTNDYVKHQGSTYKHTSRTRKARYIGSAPGPVKLGLNKLPHSL